jgi:methylisocitrate lyase
MRIFMTWFAHPKNLLSPGEQLGLLWSEQGIVRVPGAHNALAALLAKEAGFKALYLSGGALSSSLGLPDLGVMTTEELLLFVKVICRSTKLPLIVDGDTGYGEALNVMRLVQDLEAAGAAAVQLEDQILPKKCGHLSDKLLTTPEAMARKISAARKASRHLKIIARTDAAASEGFDAAVKRAQLYIEAGADMIFPEALTSKEEMKRFNAIINFPTLANMTEFGRTPYLSGEEFSELGFNVVIWPVTSLRCEAAAMKDLYENLRQNDGQGTYLDKLMKRSDIYEVIGYHNYEALDETISKSVVPDVS